MRRFIYSIALVLLCDISCFAQTFGLTFTSHEAVLEKRTSLDLTPDDSLCFSKNLSLGFDISFVPNHLTYFGYVIRIINGSDQNIDLIYDQGSKVFKIIIGEKFSGITVKIDSITLFKTWTHLDLAIDLQNNSFSCFQNGKLVGVSALLVTNPCFRFLWGANDFQKFKTRDLPPMQIKNIAISEQQKVKYFWPLDEIDGEISTDKISGRQARIKNPAWMKPKHQNWELAASFTMKGFGSVAYDSKNDKVYVTGSDSIAIYSLKNELQTVDYIPTEHQDLQISHQSIYDSIGDKLYDIYPDQKKVIPFDFISNEWKEKYGSGTVLTEFWHANKFISPFDTSLYIIAGYGQLRYRNQVYRYHFPTRTWEKISTTGDYFDPRYLAGLGSTQDGRFAYILGGYGSHTGDQMLDPTNYYDLYRYDVKNKSFKKVYTLTQPINQFTFANSLIVSSDSNEYYALMFPNDKYSSSLQLIKGSLVDSSFKMVGSPISYNFHDIQSFADLYYSPSSNKLIAVTLFYSKFEIKEQTTQVKIYTVDFPPDFLNLKLENEEHSVGKWLTFTAGVFAVLAAFFFLIIRRRLHLKKPDSEGGHAKEVIKQAVYANKFNEREKNIQSTIYLFGQFQVIDKEGQDITRAFTPLLKELLLIVLIQTIKNGRGISSEGLNEILWRDKSEKDAKNNRSVNLAKLKTILEKVGNVVIAKEGGFWQLQIPDQDIYVDYAKYALIVQAATLNKNSIEPLFEIIRRGPFLFETEYGWLDDAKSEISGKIIDRCLEYIGQTDLNKEPEQVIETANYIFYFDPLNEDALIYKCKCLVHLKRHNLANNAYLKFIKDYKNIYGEEFGKSFQQIIT